MSQERLQAYFGDHTAAETWAERARTLRDNLNRVCWNGRFYTHFVKLTPVTIPGVDETQQLSLSNPMAINCWALARLEPEVRVVGLCQGTLLGGYRVGMGALDVVFSPMTPFLMLSPEPRYMIFPGVEHDEY